MSIKARLDELGITLPETSPALASYLPVMRHGDTIFVSGQLPFRDGVVITGTLGKDVSLEDAQEAARACGLMILAQLKAELGSLDKVARIVKLGGFVASTPDFTDQHKVVNGASDLMFEVFGDIGRHARAAVGVPSLPVGACVEVDAIVAVSDG
ncbi:RidA family protein [Aurantiacibacter aquimixticola]|uniref:RidA family protein n=1 Tax=Aurantiacibacter aquimixticola TaxID=1958945 RepID=A0A419RVC0_9SPHN|nr:RidA family protein [Aurantiacibacter aquimixticola]RJY09704.1 RidA family protein [Aurantiacibacter aquimixticola]